MKSTKSLQQALWLKSRSQYRKITKALSVITVLLMYHLSAWSQLPAISPEFSLPLTPVTWAVHAGSSTLQLVNDPTLGGAPMNFYAHCWDEGDQYADCDGGIAWRITNAAGSFVGQGSIPLVGYDIDVANFVGADGRIRVLAAYFRANTSSYPGGYYYDIYRFQGGTLVPETLSVSIAPTSWYCGGINVDANIEGMGLAITWGREDQVFVKAAYSNAIFGPTVTVGALAGYGAPDVSLGTFAGTRNIYLTALAGGTISVVSVPFDDVVGGGGIFAPEGSYIAGPSVSLYSHPRIDCPDRYTHKKWAVVFGELDNSFPGFVFENVRALIKNTATASVAVPLTVHSYFSPTYNYISAQPVLAYFEQPDSIQVGWMSRHSSVDSGTIGNNGRYLTKIVGDNNGAFPVTVPTTYRFIDLVPSNSAHALAFSGQNLSSVKTGIYAAFSQRPTTSTTYMKYKHKPWGSVGFRPAPEQEENPSNPLNIGTEELTVHPNPFSDVLNVTIFQAGSYAIRLYTVDGKEVYQKNGSYNTGEKVQIPGKQLPKGIYMLSVNSTQNNIHYRKKVVK